MNLEIAPETEQRIREEIDRGHFRSVDEIIETGIQAWHERHPEAPNQPDKRSLVEVFAMLRGLADDLDLSRSPSAARTIDLE